MKNSIIILSLFIFNCGESFLRKEPFGVAVEKYESRAVSPVILASADNACSLLLHKRIFNILFVLPMNQLASDDLQLISKQKMVRYRKVMLAGDILWTTLLFLSSVISYSVEVETCETDLMIVSKDDLKKAFGRSDSDEKIPPIPILKNYLKYTGMIPVDSKLENFIIFESKKAVLTNGEREKIDKFAGDYKDKYSQYKILLIGHTDWTGESAFNIELSLKRVKAVKDYLVRQGISASKIYTTASGDYWPGNQENLGKTLNRRVDMLYLD